jgi:vacuolar protein sorting-associated protein 35
VGTNLVRLSQLDGVDLGLYNKTILVAILEQVINCKDVIAQEYLMEVIIQAFPDDFHLHTLEQLMRACVKLHPRVSVRGIVVALLDRLVSYAQRENDVDEGEEKVAHGIPSDVRLFEVFWEQIQEILRSRKEISLQDITALMVSLANLALSCYPDRLEYVDQIFQFVCERETAYEQSPDLHHAETVKNNLALLCAPIYAYPNVLTILDLENYTALLHKQSSATRRSVAMAIVQTALKQDALIETVDDVDGVLNLCTVLIKENKDSVQGRFAGTEEANLEEEQGLLARLVHLFKSDNPDEQFLLLSMARKHFVEGNDRIRFTFPPIVFMALQLARRYKNLQDKDEEWTRKATTLFRFIHQLISVLYNKSDTHELALRLFLMAAQAADQCGFEENAYDFFVQAFTIYEESLSESRAQFQALTLIVGALQATRVFGADNYETLTHKCLLHSGRLLKRPDQCRAMCLCAHLFWATPSKWHTGGGEEEELYQDGVRVKETLQRALKIADACLDASINVQLFVEILNRYIYFFELGCQEVTPVYINGLFDLVHQNISTMDPAAKKDANATQLRNASTSALMESFDGSLAELVVKHFKATVKYMERRKQDAIDDNIAGVVERYSEIELVF